MTFQITLAPEDETRLRQRAAAERIDIESFMQAAVLEKLNRPTLEELLGPIHAETERAGLTEEDIDELVERGREAYWREQQGQAR